MAISIEILAENKQFMQSIADIRDAVIKTSKLLEQIATDMGKVGKVGVNAAKDTGKAFDQADQSVKKLNDEVDRSTEGFGKLAKAAGAFFTLQAAKDFAGKVFSVRQEIESLQTSFRILVGDKDKADALFQGIKEFAVSTPMQLKDLASAAQTMMGFGLPLEQVMENLKAIGDVSMGDTQRFQALSLAFSQMSAAGKLMGQDLMQMINAGFNPLATISEKTGKSIGDLKKEMEGGSISADMVRQAFIDATSEGGKFYNMLNEQSKTLKGAYSNLQGAINDMLNDIGTKTDGVFKGAIDTATSLAKHYEDVGKVLATLTISFGAYKAAVIAITAAEKGWTAVEAVHYAWLVLQEKAQKALNATMLNNPYVIAATALTAVVSALILFKRGTDDAAESTKKLNETFSQTQAEISAEQRKIDRLFEKLQKAKKGTNAYKSAKDAILSQYGSYLSGLSSEVASLQNVEAAYKAVSKAARDAALARGMEAAMKTAQTDYTDTYSENYDKIFNAIEKNYGTDYAKSIMGGVSKSLRAGKLDSRVIDAVGSLKGVKAGWLVNLSYNEQSFQKTQNQIREKFKIEDTDTTLKNTDTTLKNTVRNKNAIEAEKKAAQAELDALSEIEAAGKKGKEIRKRIAGYDKELAFYNANYDDKQTKAGAAAARKAEADQRKELQELIKAGEAKEKIDELTRKQQSERERDVRDLELSTTEARIKAMKDGTEKTIKQIEFDYEKESEAIKRAYDDMRIKRIEDAKSIWDANPNNKGKNFYASDAYNAANINTDAERNNYQLKIDAAKIAMQRSLYNAFNGYDTESAKETEKIRQLSADILAMEQQKAKVEKDLMVARDLGNKEEIETAEKSIKMWEDRIRLATHLKDINSDDAARIEYLKNYGSWSGKESALREDYGRRIAEATAQSGADSYAVKILQEQFDDALAQLNLEKLKEDINWDAVFGDLDKLTKKELKKLKVQLQELSKGFEGDPEQMKVMMEGINAVNETLVGRDSFFTGLKEAVKEVESADAQLAAAENFLAEARNGGSEEALKDAEKAVRMARNRKQSAQQNVSVIEDKNLKSIQTLFSSLGSLGKGNLSNLGGLAEGIAQLAGASDKNSSKIGSWVGMVAGLVEQIAAQGFEGFISGVFSDIGDALGAVLNDIGKWLGLGDLGGFLGSSYKDLEKDMNNLRESNKDLERAIDGLREEMQKATIEESKGLYEQSKRAAEMSLENYRKMLAETAGANSNGFLGIGGSRSANAHIGDKMSELNPQWLQVINSLLGRDIQSISQLWSLLSPEEWKKIAEQFPEYYSAIKQASEEGYKGISEILDSYVDQADRIEELEKAYNEKLTSTSFDSVRDEFKSLVMDMDSTAEDFADNFEKYMKNAIFEALMLKTYEPLLEEWYKEFAEYNEDGTINGVEQDRLRSKWDNIVNSAIADRDRLYDAMGWGNSSEAEAAYNASKTFTQEQGDVLNGRLSAIYENQVRDFLNDQQIGQQIAASISHMEEMTSSLSGSGEAVIEIRNMMVTANSHLDDISTNTRRMLNEFGEKIEKIVNNTKNL